MKASTTICGFSALLILAVLPAAAANENMAWTDPATALKEDTDFAIQGE